jgi:hypothetical protein
MRAAEERLGGAHRMIGASFLFQKEAYAYR